MKKKADDLQAVAEQIRIWLLQISNEQVANATEQSSHLFDRIKNVATPVDIALVPRLKSGVKSIGERVVLSSRNALDTVSLALCFASLVEVMADHDLIADYDLLMIGSDGVGFAFRFPDKFAAVGM